MKFLDQGEPEQTDRQTDRQTRNRKHYHAASLGVKYLPLTTLSYVNVCSVCIN